ncbi:MAG TPA: phage major capsid protein [Nitrospira sp.]|jgi:HK97 family phage major capsid protein|nr:phage major capsid protein [Nitrospira sp.]HQW88761.1 phage major capsid protein [Nitrospira sp.]HQZ90472.1 phage major capsid protein [Thermomicrobiales bacterium]HRA32654.1 phage major capsid protein [Thermomicrobiales bacterium]
MYRTLAEKNGRLAHLRGEWQTLWSSKPDRDFSDDEVASLRQMNEEMTDLAAGIEQLQELEAMATRNVGPSGLPIVVDRDTQQKAAPAQRLRSTREVLEASEGYRAFRERRGGTVAFEFGADTRLGAAFDPEVGATLLTLADINVPAQRLPGIVPMALEERTIADLMLPGTTDGNTIEYYEETTFTNAAVETAEGGTKPEAALDYTLRTESVRKIPVWLPATDELLADLSQMRATIEGRLIFMVRRREETQLLAGDGNAPNISGILDRSGIQTQAKGADPVPDAIYKGMTKIRSVAFAEPTAAVFHPNDWQDVRLLRTTDGVYIWGSPAEAGPERIWGLDVRITTAMTENTALLGAFKPYAQIFRRTGITVTASTEHSTYFIENKVAILAEERLALAVYRPAAFCTVTGI